jgi:hypothetical protein
LVIREDYETRTKKRMEGRVSNQRSKRGHEDTKCRDQPEGKYAREKEETGRFKEAY